MPESIYLTPAEIARQEAFDRVKKPVRICFNCKEGIRTEGEIWCCKFEREEADLCRENDHDGWVSKAEPAQRKEEIEPPAPIVRKRNRPIKRKSMRLL